MNQNLVKFGEFLKELRLKKELSLREICRLVNYDPSNWSKIERGVLSPPSDIETLRKWTKILGISSKPQDKQKFIDSAMIAQGIIPNDILIESRIELLPAFFRTLRNKKPSKEMKNLSKKKLNSFGV